MLLFNREKAHVHSTAVCLLPDLLRPCVSGGLPDRPALNSWRVIDPVSPSVGTAGVWVYFLHNLVSLDDDSWSQA